MDFKPAMSLRGGVSFEAKKNELEVAAQENADGETSDTSSLSSSDEEKIGHNVNHARKHGKTPSTATAAGQAQVPIAPIGPTTPRKHTRKLSEQISLTPNTNGHRAQPSMDRTSILTSDTRGEADVENPEKGVVMSQEDIFSHRTSSSFRLADG